MDTAHRASSFAALMQRPSRPTSGFGNGNNARHQSHGGGVYNNNAYYSANAYNPTRDFALVDGSTSTGGLGPNYRTDGARSLGSSAQGVRLLTHPLHPCA